MTDYRLDPNNPRRLTPEEARRLDETPIDYSDIPSLGDQFFSQAKRTISPEEMERRRTHVRAAIADSRIEGIATSAEELEILEAYIRGEIEAGDLVTVYLNRRNRS
jgi:hypothetical protein